MCMEIAKHTFIWYGPRTTQPHNTNPENSIEIHAKNFITVQADVPLQKTVTGIKKNKSKIRIMDIDCSTKAISLVP
jgi:hypothetical protein